MVRISWCSHLSSTKYQPGKALHLSGLSVLSRRAVRWAPVSSRSYVPSEWNSSCYNAVLSVVSAHLLLPVTLLLSILYSSSGSRSSLVKVTQMEEWGFKPGSAGFYSWCYFLLATQICDHLDNSLKREHRVGRKLESQPLRKEGRKEWLCPGCAAGRGGQRGCSPCLASPGQRELVSS